MRLFSCHRQRYRRQRPNNGEFAPFINIMSEWYLRDLSRKQRTAIRVKGETGKSTTNCAISNEAEFIHKVREASAVRQEQAVKDI